MSKPPARLLTIEVFVEILRQAFPGVEVERGTSISSEIASIAIVEYQLQGTLTVRKVSLSDEPGTVYLAFSQRLEGHKPKIRRKLQTAQLSEVQNFVDWVRAVLMGTLLALEAAFEVQPEPEPIDPGIASLFEEEDWHGLSSN